MTPNCSKFKPNVKQIDILMTLVLLRSRQNSLYDIKLIFLANKIGVLQPEFNHTAIKRKHLQVLEYHW